MITGLRRSSLYVPGDMERMVAKAAASAADQLMLNLEDGIAAGRKDAARAGVARALRTVDFGRRERVVRVNPLRTEHGRCDLAEIVPARPDGLCFPKIELPAELREADAAVVELERRHGLPEGGLRFHAMIESARGLVHAAEIAAATGRMTSLIFGAADFVADLRCRPGPDRTELLLVLQQLVVAARSAGLDAIDGPYFDFRDRAGLRREADGARRLGFDGKSALHPDQLAGINEAFDVTPDEVAWARRVLVELDEAERQGRSLATLDGALIDDPHRVAARRILTRDAARVGSDRS